MMSASSHRWISIAFSGVSRWREPSMWDWKVTPSGVIRASLASENTWNPPLSVRMAPGQRMKPCRPLKLRITSSPGRR